MASEYVPIFFDWMENTQDLTDEEKGRLIDAVIEYFVNDGEQEVIDETDSYKLRDIFLLTIDKATKYFANPHSSEFHWNWKGGITPANQRGRSSGKYLAWRKAVFERDQYTCQICGKVGGGLNAHHIKRWSTNPEYRYSVDNGVTLCEQCHKGLHKNRR